MIDNAPLLAETPYWSAPVPLAELIAETLDWSSRNADAAGPRLDAIERDLPRGSGIDSGTTIDRDCTAPESGFTLASSWHAMDSNGFYAGWFDFTVCVVATFAGPVVSIDWTHGTPEQDYECDCETEEEEEEPRSTCDQCVAVTINGVYCHEHGCPNAGRGPLMAPECNCEWVGVSDPSDYIGDVFREAMRDMHARIEYDDPPDSRGVTMA